LELNKKNKNGKNPILGALQNNIKLIKFLIDYARENNNNFNLNDKDNNDIYPILKAVDNNNMKIVQLLIEYLNKNIFILQMWTRKRKKVLMALMITSFYKLIIIL